MKKQVNKMIGFVCYIIGVVCSVYFGLWKMLLIPLRMLYWEAIEARRMKRRDEDEKERQAS